MNSKLVPENEMGVIALFAMACEAYGWTIDRTCDYAYWRTNGRTNTGTGTAK